MKIAVINGSPKGDYSSTLYTVKYINLLFPEYSFNVIDAGRLIKRYEKDFSEAASVLQAADLILFSYPVYTFIVPSQLHRFIELMKESGIDFSEKYATQISTSKHFYDVTAHKFILDNCHDMHMKCIKGLSADMEDLPTEKGQKDAEKFFRYVLWCMETGTYEYEQPAAEKKEPVPVGTCEESEKTGSKQVVIVADIEDGDSQLSDMIDRFCRKLPYRTSVVNIEDFPFKGGCISCFNCAPAGKCIYKDGFDEYLRNNIQTADAIVTAFSIKDHSMGSRFKLYDDRQFCNGHRTVTMGKPTGYLVNGEYSREENLRMILEGRAEVGGNFLCGVATNEFCPDREIDNLAACLEYALENEYSQPSNFLGVGGMKVFRDLIWMMQGLMKADHKFYKSHGQYDFPQKKWPTMLAMYLVGGMMANEKIKAKIGNKMSEGMVMAHKKALDNAKKRMNK